MPIYLSSVIGWMKNCFNVLSSLYVCMVIKHIIVLFVETPPKFITAKNCLSPVSV